MAYFPMFVQLEGCKCLVVGGGRVALRKCRILEEFGAVVLVAAREACGELQKFAGENQSVCLALRKARVEDADGMALVVCASDDREFHRRMAEYCRSKGIPVNVADDQENSTFLFPGIVRQEDVVIGISTGGKSPAVVRYLKQELKGQLPGYLGKLVSRLGDLRPLVKKRLPEQKKREKVFSRLAQAGLKNGGEISREMAEEVIRQER